MAASNNRDEWQTAVYTLMGHASALYTEGQRDMPEWLYGLAERIARAHLDEHTATRVRLVAEQRRATPPQPGDSGMDATPAQAGKGE